jgi:hypothetical protein
MNLIRGSHSWSSSEAFLPKPIKGLSFLNFIRGSYSWTSSEALIHEPHRIFFLSLIRDSHSWTSSGALTLNFNNSIHLITFTCGSDISITQNRGPHFTVINIMRCPHFSWETLTSFYITCRSSHFCILIKEPHIFAVTNRYYFTTSSKPLSSLSPQFLSYERSYRKLNLNWSPDFFILTQEPLFRHPHCLIRTRSPQF